MTKLGAFSFYRGAKVAHIFFPPVIKCPARVSRLFHGWFKDSGGRPSVALRSG